ncbi:NAD(P)/FAD-dependent oxidoreductase [Candidatus Micrarchaeota archaeon]|nr:NAD(P)/FAD-dependent oxidoreductase [Candidatus Micrarchaeota archaeon]
MYDAVVAGASVIGGVCARELASRGIRTVLLSDQPGIGKDGKCTCIISRKGLDKTGINYSDAVLQKIDGARVWSGSACMEVRSKEVALVLNRFLLDATSVEQAQDKGAELKRNSPFRELHGEIVESLVPIRTKTVIGADGIASHVARSQNFPQLEEIVVAWEAEYGNADLEDSSIVDVFTDFPGLLAWSVPCGENSVRVGLAVKNNIQEHKRRLFLKPRIQKTLKNAEKKREFYHSIPLRYRRQTQKNNVLLVGDAAGQVKASTGGGIVFGSLCAIEAAEQTKQFLGGGVLDYENSWRSKYAKTLDRHQLIRKTLDATPSFVATTGLHVLNAIKFNRFFEGKGDMDFILK